MGLHVISVIVLGGAPQPLKSNGVYSIPLQLGHMIYCCFGWDTPTSEIQRCLFHTHPIRTYDLLLFWVSKGVFFHTPPIRTYDLLLFWVGHPNH